jgi:hypothetical protein
MSKTYARPSIAAHIEKALDLFNKGFCTKADQKRCQEQVSRAFEKLRHNVMNGLLDLRNDCKMSDEDMSPLYYDFPMDLHQYRPLKHSPKYFALFPEEVKEIEYLVELRNQVKATPIVKVVVDKVYEEKVARIEKSLFEICQAQLDSYERGLEFAKLFGGLHVSVTPHWVHRDGGRFIRYFYYMNYKLTALNTILAIMQTLEDEKENEVLI